MTDPTPPPERPLRDQARARIRAELLAHADEHRSGARSWSVPLGAAAAVALVAGLAFWAVGVRGGDGDVAPLTGATPSAAVTPSDVSSSSVPDMTSSTISPQPGPGATVNVEATGCEAEMEHVLKGATLARHVEGRVLSSFWVKGEKFVLCDELQGGRTTVHRALPLTPRDDVATYAVSSDYLAGLTTRSAGGIVPTGLEDVFDVAYTFPDGHTEHATMATDQGRTWWRMTYTYAESRESQLSTPGISVTVSWSGVQKEYVLAWGADTCAQANHGC